MTMDMTMVICCKRVNTRLQPCQSPAGHLTAPCFHTLATHLPMGKAC